MTWEKERPDYLFAIAVNLCILSTPAITNAIYNAVGVRVDKLPVDQEMIAREIWEREEK